MEHQYGPHRRYSCHNCLRGPFGSRTEQRRFLPIAWPNAIQSGSATDSSGRREGLCTRPHSDPIRRGEGSCPWRKSEEDEVTSSKSLKLCPRIEPLVGPELTIRWMAREDVLARLSLAPRQGGFQQYAREAIEAERSECATSMEGKTCVITGATSGIGRAA